MAASTPYAGTDKKSLHNYKLIGDPQLNAELKTKVYRVDGIVDKAFRNHQHYEEATLVADPRRNPQHRYRSHPFHQTVNLLPTKFVIDGNYTGTPPQVELLLENLNDNVREDFLRAMLVKVAGTVLHLSIAYHPTSKKHLGIAHVEFETETASSSCLRHMQGRSVMGNVISCSRDPLGKKFRSLTEELISEMDKPKLVVTRPAPAAVPIPEAVKVAPLAATAPCPEVLPPAVTSTHSTPATFIAPPSTHSASTKSMNGGYTVPYEVLPPISSSPSAASVSSKRSLDEMRNVTSPCRDFVVTAPPPPVQPVIRQSLEERIQSLRKDKDGLLARFGDLISDSSDDEDEQRTPNGKRADTEGGADGSMAGTSPVTPMASPPSKRSRFEVPAPEGSSAQVPLPPPGLIFLNKTADKHLTPTMKVDPKANLLSQLFLHTGLYSMQTAPADLRAFYRSFFCPLINPAQVHEDCTRSLDSDLRRVMTRDIRKKVVDALVFKQMDAWNEKNQREYNERMSIRNVPSCVPHVMDITNTVDQILKGDSSLFSGGRMTAGLGLRNAMPKMPSFKRQKLLPAASLDQENEHEAPLPSPPDAPPSLKSEAADSSQTVQDVPQKKGSRTEKERKRLKVESEEKKKKRSGGESTPPVLERKQEAGIKLAKPISKPSSEYLKKLASPAKLDPPSQRSQIAKDKKENDVAHKHPLELHVASLQTPSDSTLDPSKSESNQLEREVATEEPEFNAFELLLEASKLVDMNDQFVEKQNHLIQEEKKKKSPSKGAAVWKKEEKIYTPPPPVVHTTPKIPPWRQELFEERPHELESAVLRVILDEGIDREDIKFLKEVSDDLLLADSCPAWIKVFHWVDHPPTYLPSLSNEGEPSEGGCARCTPYKRATRRILHLRKNATVDATVGQVEKVERVSAPDVTAARDQIAGDLDARKAVALEIEGKSKGKGLSAREARLNKRRVMSDLDHTIGELGIDLSDMTKFYTLRHATKRVRFGRSRIHNWGLFAQEPIAPDEMVIEYIGEKIRANIADLREKRYERVGIGSSYLFRVDDYSVIDATKCGNVARFMNHCCTPNSYAKVISVDGSKKIVVFSKQQINTGDEITYDYKFPIEENKIPCLCGSKGCRGSLN